MQFLSCRRWCAPNNSGRHSESVKVVGAIDIEKLFFVGDVLPV